MNLNQEIKKARKIISIIALLFFTMKGFAFDEGERLGHVVIQAGGYWSNQGKSQHIDIAGLIGDEMTVTNGHENNLLVGLGYFIDAQEKDLFDIAYGINAFYLAKTTVKGDVIQENLFTNLSYGYDITHYPIYAVAKSTIKTGSLIGLTIDVGIGPNLMRTDSFHEHSLDGDMTIPDHVFSGHTTTTFSATAGVGIKSNNIFGPLSLECGYRFFYLGQGHFNKNNHQLLNTLKTGSGYANAALCSITV